MVRLVIIRTSINYVAPYEKTYSFHYSMCETIGNSLKKTFLISISCRISETLNYMGKWLDLRYT